MKTLSFNENILFFVLLSYILLLLMFTIMPDLFSPYKYTTQKIIHSLEAPSSSYLLGTDQFGRDILSRIIYGTRTVIFVSLTSIIVALIFGIPIGLIAGYYSGIIDSLFMRFQDAILSFPVLLLALLLISTFGASTLNVIIAISFVFIPRFARLIRGIVLEEKNKEYVTAAKAIGASNLRIMFFSILPNSIGPLIVQISLAFAISILIEAGLSYLGLGIQPPNPSWGNMLQHSQNYFYRAPWFVLSPGIAIFLTVLSFNLIGDILGKILDPLYIKRNY